MIRLLVNVILTVSSCEVRKRIVALLVVHELKHHVGVVDERSDSKTLDQHVLKVVRIELCCVVCNSVYVILQLSKRNVCMYGRN